MDAYMISCKVDIQKLTSPISTVERLELHQISQGLVRGELYLCMTCSSAYTFKDFMNWLWHLLPESQFNPSGENIIRQRISKIKKNLPSATLSVQSLRTQSSGEVNSPD